MERNVKNNGQRTGQTRQAQKLTVTQKAARVLLHILAGDAGASQGGKASRPRQGQAAAAGGTPQGRPAAAGAARRGPLTLEQRRQLAVRRAQQQRMLQRRKKLRALAIAVAAALLLLILSLTVFFKIDTINVSAQEDTAYSDAQVVEVCGIAPGTVNLFRCDLEKVSQTIEKKLPYIGSAVVKRDFPNALKVTLEPTSAVAAIDMNTGYLLIDKNAKMLEYITATPSAIAVLHCRTDFEVRIGEIISQTQSETQQDKQDDDSQTEVKAGTEPEFITLFKEIIDAIEKSKLKSITLIDIRDKDEIKLTYQDRITLHVGTDTSLVEKLTLAQKTLVVEDDSSKTKTGIIDLSRHNEARVDDGSGYSGGIVSDETTQAADN